MLKNSMRDFSRVINCTFLTLREKSSQLWLCMKLGCLPSGVLDLMMQKGVTNFENMLVSALKDYRWKTIITLFSCCQLVSFMCGMQDTCYCRYVH
jgi:hypothetical protein